MSVISSYRKQAGDTIVEVLIAVAIVSGVLGTAYAIVNKTVLSSQQAQEHSQALKIAESQFEQFQANAAGVIAGFNLTPDPMAFCMENGEPINTNLQLEATNDTVESNPASYNTCRFRDGTINDRFLVRITRSTSSETYKVHVTWDGPTGGTDTVNLAYKVYP